MLSSGILNKIIPRAHIRYGRQYLSFPAIFVDTYQLLYLWSMVCELIYQCLLTSQLGNCNIPSLVFVTTAPVPVVTIAVM